MLSEATFMAVGAAKSGGSTTFWSTLLGAVVGGLVSLGTTLLVERQRNKAATEAEERRALADARLAARVIVLELRDAASVLRVTLQRSTFSWPPSSDFQFATAAWDDQSATLGSAAPDQLWETVALPYSSFKYTNLLRAVNEGSARTMLDESEAAIRALEEWAASATLQR